MSALRELERLGLGEIREARSRSRAGQDSRDVVFYRKPLSPTLTETLDTLGMPASTWRASVEDEEQCCLRCVGALDRNRWQQAAPVRRRPAATMAAAAVLPRPAASKWYTGLAETHTCVATICCTRCPTAQSIQGTLTAASQGASARALPEVLTSYAMRKAGNFHLRCLGCKPRTCSWKGYAVFQETAQELEIWAAKTGKHGVKREAPAKVGRKRKHESEWREPVAAWTHSGEEWSGKTFLREVKTYWFEKLSGKSTVRRRCRFRCCSHLTGVGKLCPWRRHATYDMGRKRVAIFVSASHKHAGAARKFDGNLTKWPTARTAGLRGADAYDLLCDPRQSWSSVGPAPNPPRESGSCKGGQRGAMHAWV